MKHILISLLLVAFVCTAAFGQAPTAIQQSGSRTDAATFLATSLGGATSCATVNTTTANGTVTITPPAGQYVYITGVFIDLTSDITGTTSVATMSTTNLTGSPVWSLATILAAGAASATNRQIAEVYPTGLRSTVPGTAVTFVPSAQIAHTIVCTRVAGYYAP
jgi:hypothetical protein